MLESKQQPMHWYEAKEKCTENSYAYYYKSKWLLCDDFTVTSENVNDSWLCVASTF